MQFSKDNKVVALCVRGMELESNGQSAQAADLFQEAWNEASDDFEKFTAAHYVARHQQTVTDKLHWDKLALQHALNIDNPNIKASLPSLYLNIAKCYEDLNDIQEAKRNYHEALSYTDLLPQDEYGKMIKKGIANGIERAK